MTARSTSTEPGSGRTEGKVFPADRYPSDPRRTAERCPHCEAGYVFYDEERELEPTCAVFVCANHFVTGNGDCPGAAIKVYEDGFVRRQVADTG